jgi:hypothetical protein
MHPQHHHLVVYLMTAARIFTTKTFSKWQRKTGLSDKSLIKAIQEIQSGLVDARLAKGLVKKEWLNQVGASKAAQEHWLPPILKPVGFSFLVFRKMKNQILLRRNCNG